MSGLPSLDLITVPTDEMDSNQGILHATLSVTNVPRIYGLSSLNVITVPMDELDETQRMREGPL